jgi:hypothetical protein
MSTVFTATSVKSWFSSGSAYLVQPVPIFPPRPVQKKLPSLSALKKQIAAEEQLASVKAEENGMRLLGRKHI